jgi:DNA-binding response OmpR family regulator
MMTTRPDQILVVDDEANIRLTLQALLSRAGYEVTLAASGQEAIDLFNQREFDLLLVDLKMPDVDGMQVVTESRKRLPDATIIVLTGHGSLDTALAGLRQGIFDYLLKTTDPAEVVERVHAGLADRQQKLRQQKLLETVSSAVQELRDSGKAAAQNSQSGENQQAAPAAPAEQPAERIINVGNLQIDTWRQSATFAGRLLMLTPTEFRVLLCLAEHVGNMLTYTQIVRCAQGYESSEPEASELIKPHIYHLRQKLEPDPGTPRYLLNVRGKGYMLQV